MDFFENEWIISIGSGLVLLFSEMAINSIKEKRYLSAILTMNKY